MAQRPAPQRGQEPSIWKKMGMGAMMGTGVGLTIGFIFGSYSIIRAGPGPRGAMATLSQYMLSSAATFGFFLAIGSVIRTDSPEMARIEYLRNQHLHPVMNSRTAGIGMLKARWELERRRQQAN